MKKRTRLVEWWSCHPFFLAFWHIIYRMCMVWRIIVYILRPKYSYKINKMNGKKHKIYCHSSVHKIRRIIFESLLIVLHYLASEFWRLHGRMEELQDAIEDAQYVNAMHDESPKPTKEWKFPSPEALNQYLTRASFKEPQRLELDVICEDSLGFYLVLLKIKNKQQIASPTLLKYFFSPITLCHIAVRWLCEN